MTGAVVLEIDTLEDVPRYLVETHSLEPLWVHEHELTRNR
jgi:hypothetical protein